jgi:Uma2 family endonuclease
MEPGNSFEGRRDAIEARSQGGKGRWTYAEFARLPSERGTRHEFIAGDLVTAPAPSRRHQRVSMDLGMLLNAFVQSHDLGEVYHRPFDVLLAEGDYLEPDLLFVRKERLHLLSSSEHVIRIISARKASRHEARTYVTRSR